MLNYNILIFQRKIKIQKFYICDIKKGIFMLKISFGNIVKINAPLDTVDTFITSEAGKKNEQLKALLGTTANLETHPFDEYSTHVFSGKHAEECSDSFIQAMHDTDAAHRYYGASDIVDAATNEVWGWHNDRVQKIIDDAQPIPEIDIVYNDDGETVKHLDVII